MKIYVGASLEESATAKTIIIKLIDLGHTITYDWTKHGRVTDPALLKEYGQEEVEGVVTSDLFFMYYPARLGTHVELGIAIALHKPVILLIDINNPRYDQSKFEDKTFYYVDNVTKYYDLDQALNHVKQLNRLYVHNQLSTTFSIDGDKL
jgi:hypothetical protein